MLEEILIVVLSIFTLYQELLSCVGYIITENMAVYLLQPFGLTRILR